MVRFLTMGDRNYFSTITFSAEQIKKFYPKSTFHIYDWGFTAEQISELKKVGNTVIIPWEVSRENILSTNFGKTWRYYVRKYLFGRKGLDKIRIKEYLLCQKVYCMLDCNKNSNEPVVFLDGDAFLINNIDKVLAESIDIAVTLRRMKELRYGGLFSKCNMLNSGVIFFLGNKEKRVQFIKRWIREMKKTSKDLFEQTSLTYIVKKAEKNIYNGYFREGQLTIAGQSIHIEVLPCELFNYNWVEEGFDKTSVKILHLKSGRFTNREIKQVMKKYGK